ncbi:MAG: ComEC/Rec2 family competence protein [Chloroflexi bacterium]|nr:ComEC/Rec2 family competence protein [Chloroflexota bacterium]
MLLWLACAWLLGLGWSALGGPPSSSPLPAAGLLTAGGLLTPNRGVRIAVLCGAAFLLGLARGSIPSPPDSLAALGGQTLELRGSVSAPPTCQPAWCLVPVEVEQARAGDAWTDTPSKLNVWTDGRQPPAFGQGVLLRGRLRVESTGSPARGPGLVAASMFHPVIRTVERAGFDVRVPLERARAALERRLSELVPGPAGQLAAGLLLGRQALLDPALRDQMRATGTSHLMAVSGYNVAVVAGILLAGLSRLVHRRLAVLAAMGGVVLYTALVGAPPSAVRAAFMAGATSLSVLVGRLPDALTSLVVAAAIMVGVDPILVSDVGFQFSCAATAGLVLLAQPLDNTLPRKLRPILEPLVVTLAAEIATLPLVLHYFQSAQLVGPLANVLVQPSITPLMALGALALLLGWLWPFALVLGGLAQLVGGYMSAVLAWTAGLPGAGARSGGFPIWAVLASYAILLAAIALTRTTPFKTWSLPRRLATVGLSLPVALALLLFAVDRPSLAPGELRVRFLDGPASDLALVEVGGGPRLLVGAAQAANAVGIIGERLPCLNRSLDLFVVTDASERVASWVEELLRRYPPRALVRPRQTDATAPLVQAAADARPSVTTWSVEDSLHLAIGSELELEAASEADEAGPRRLAVQLRYRGARVVLPGGRPIGPWSDGPTVVKLARGQSPPADLLQTISAPTSLLVFPSAPSGRALDRLPERPRVVRLDQTGELELRLGGPLLRVTPLRCPDRAFDLLLDALGPSADAPFAVLARCSP